jgi:hypothetical protein
MPLTYSGSAVIGASSVTIPTHAVGDLIVICAFRVDFGGSTTPPSVPSAGGTVPTFTTITANTGTSGASYQASMRTAYAVATATNHTSGTWTDADYSCAVVLSGANTTTPIGGYAESGGTSSGSSTAPSVTLSKSDGTSQLLCFHVWVGTLSTAPSGYTRRAGLGTVCFNTKDSTTSDGSVVQSYTAGGAGRPYRGAQIEVLQAATIGSFFAMF